MNLHMCECAYVCVYVYAYVCVRLCKFLYMFVSVSVCVWRQQERRLQMMTCLINGGLRVLGINR